jgi:hypothetical protein
LILRPACCIRLSFQDTTIILALRHTTNYKASEKL